MNARERVLMNEGIPTCRMRPDSAVLSPSCTTVSYLIGGYEALGCVTWWLFVGWERGCRVGDREVETQGGGSRDTTFILSALSKVGLKCMNGMQACRMERRN